MKTHHLKTWPIYFKEVKSGNKKFEIRKNDRDFKEGDFLVLEEWSSTFKYHGNAIIKKVGFVLYGGEFGLDADSCCMSLIDM